MEHESECLKRTSSTRNWYQHCQWFTVKSGKMVQIRDPKIVFLTWVLRKAHRVMSGWGWGGGSSSLTFPEDLVNQQKKGTSFLCPRDGGSLGDPNETWDLSTSQKPFSLSAEWKIQNLWKYVEKRNTQENITAIFISCLTEKLVIDRIHPLVRPWSRKELLPHWKQTSSSGTCWCGH